MNIVIFGASGKTGQHVVRQALASGHTITAFCRTTAKLPLSDTGLYIIQGDATNYPAVYAAVSSQDGVIVTLGAARPTIFDQSVVEAMANIVKAMEASRVHRLVYMSAINVAASRPQAGLLVRFAATTALKSETKGHEEREKIVHQSNLDWTIVRPGKLSNGPHRAYRIGEDIRAKGLFAGISRTDVADFLVKQAADKTFLHKHPVIMY